MQTLKIPVSKTLMYSQYLYVYEDGDNPWFCTVSLALTVAQFFFNFLAFINTVVNNLQVRITEITLTVLNPQEKSGLMPCTKQ